jgi:hypothetical protein
MRLARFSSGGGGIAALTWPGCRVRGGQRPAKEVEPAPVEVGGRVAEQSSPRTASCTARVHGIEVPDM